MNTIKKFKKYSNLKNILIKRKEEVLLINKILKNHEKSKENKKIKKNSL